MTVSISLLAVVVDSRQDVVCLADIVHLRCEQ